MTADSFMVEFRTRTERMAGPYRTYRDLAIIEVAPLDGAIVVKYVTSMQPQGRGAGKAALNLLCTLADKHAVTLRLVARPVKRGNKRILTQTQLIAWYERHGFTCVGRTAELKRQPGSAIPPATT
jgi:hypothetical protein